MEADEIVRERALKFLLNKVKLLPEEALTKEIEDLIVTESKKVSNLPSCKRKILLCSNFVIIFPLVKESDIIILLSCCYI